MLHITPYMTSYEHTVYVARTVHGIKLQN